jgi:two-component system, NarL family, response regulator NreC
MPVCTEDILAGTSKEEQPVEEGDLPLDSLADLGANLASRPYARRGAPAPDRVIRVILVDDHTIVREGVRSLLADVPDIKVVGEGANGVDTIALVEQLHPDIVVMDLDMPGGDGLTATRQLMEMEEPPRVLVLTMHAEEKRLVSTLEAGASGYLMKDAAEHDLVEAIRTIANGDVYVRPRVARLLAASMRPSLQLEETNESALLLEKLSDREKTVLCLVAEGFNGPEIGRKLGITSKTVDTYKQRIETKLGLSHRSEYVRFALSAGLLDLNKPGG